MHKLPTLRPWMITIVVVILVTAHAFMLYRVSSHMALGLAASGVILLLFMKHLGLLGSFARIRQRSRRL